MAFAGAPEEQRIEGLSRRQVHGVVEDGAGDRRGTEHHAGGQFERL